MYIRYRMEGKIYNIRYNPGLATVGYGVIEYKGNNIRH